MLHKSDRNSYGWHFGLEHTCWVHCQLSCHLFS